MTYLKVTSDGQALCGDCGNGLDGVLVNTADQEGLVCFNCYSDSQPTTEGLEIK